MKSVFYFISKFFSKDQPKPEKTATKKYATEVIDKYKKTLKRLSYE